MWQVVVGGSIWVILYLTHTWVFIHTLFFVPCYFYINTGHFAFWINLNENQFQINLGVFLSSLPSTSEETTTISSHKILWCVLYNWSVWGNSRRYFSFYIFIFSFHHKGVVQTLTTNSFVFDFVFVFLFWLS